MEPLDQWLHFFFRRANYVEPRLVERRSRGSETEIITTCMLVVLPQRRSCIAVRRCEPAR
jgi:hypothetical protein